MLKSEHDPSTMSPDELIRSEDHEFFKLISDYSAFKRKAKTNHERAFINTIWVKL